MSLCFGFYSHFTKSPNFLNQNCICKCVGDSICKRSAFTPTVVKNRTAFAQLYSCPATHRSQGATVTSQEDYVSHKPLGSCPGDWLEDAAVA